ncbi:MAG: hypothetical protein AAFU79_00510, partial [Myxococcota bacterium]
MADEDKQKEPSHFEKCGVLKLHEDGTASVKLRDGKIVDIDRPSYGIIRRYDKVGEDKQADADEWLMKELCGLTSERIENLDFGTDYQAIQEGLSYVMGKSHLKTSAE